jgi:hypothetical protein
MKQQPPKPRPVFLKGLICGLDGHCRTVVRDPLTGRPKILPLRKEQR